MRLPIRRVVVFAVLFTLYQSAEGIGARLLHSFPVQAALMLACVLAAWPLGHWLGMRGYRAYGLQGRHWAFWLLGGLVLSAMASLSSLALGLGLGWLAWRPGPGIHTFVPALPVMLMAALSTFVPSIAEDILTRGFWWRASGIRWRAPVFVAVSAAIYTLNHIYRLAHGPSEWIMLFAFGIAYASAMLRSGSLWPAVGLHWGWNLSNAWFGHLLPVVMLDHAAMQNLWALANLGMAVVVLSLPLSSRRSAAPGA